MHNHFPRISTSPGVFEQNDLVEHNHETAKTPFWLAETSGRGDPLAGVDEEQQKRREEALALSSDLNEVQEKIVAEEDENNFYTDVDDIDLFGIADACISGLSSCTDEDANAEPYGPASLNTISMARSGVPSLWAGHELPLDINPGFHPRVRYTLPDLAHWMPHPVRPIELETKKNSKRRWNSVVA
ncbi:hypothetical protein PQX77_003333 [Marasmius sp. AFHP31]|nr:hypothetical protein PQX77_003333 [Marasmius sp. AFHP31]